MTGENESYGAEAALQEVQKEAVSDIRRDKKPDAELLDILNSHIVTLTPDTSAVEQAVADICNLAKERAKS